ncbi:MAG TPA: hypothetical protein VKH37_08300 [Ferruginibacter sp.]|nr:hypothetical protein [Ferruginibacter sp.]
MGTQLEWLLKRIIDRTLVSIPKQMFVKIFWKKNDYLTPIEGEKQQLTISTYRVICHGATFQPVAIILFYSSYQSLT